MPKTDILKPACLCDICSNTNDPPRKDLTEGRYIHNYFCKVTDSSLTLKPSIKAVFIQLFKQNLSGI